MRRYHIQHRDDYHKYVPPRFPFSLTACSRYNKLCGTLRSFAHRLSMLPAQDPFRATMEGQLLSKLYDMGVLNSQAKLSDLENKLTVSAFCRRRLAVFVCMSKMSETVSAVCLSPSSFAPIHQHACCRLRNSSNRVISVSDQTPSRILHSLSQGEWSLYSTGLVPQSHYSGTWRTLSPGWTPPKSREPSCHTTTR